MGPILARKFARHTSAETAVLDFGCGNAAVISALAARRRVAVEPNPASRAAHDPALVESVANLASVADRSVDVAISNHALEHCLHPLSDLLDLRRKIVRGGTFVLVVPIDDWRAQRRDDPTDVNHHLYTWTPRLLGNLLREAGFTIERIDVVRHAWPPGVFYLSRLPEPIFDLICRAWSRLSLVSEIHAVATVP